MYPYFQIIFNLLLVIIPFLRRKLSETNSWVCCYNIKNENCGPASQFLSTFWQTLLSIFSIAQNAVLAPLFWIWKSKPLTKTWWFKWYHKSIFFLCLWTAIHRYLAKVPTCNDNLVCYWYWRNFCQLCAKTSLKLITIQYHLGLFCIQLNSVFKTTYSLLLHQLNYKDDVSTNVL